LPDRRILIVDDSQTDIDLLLLAFQREGVTDSIDAVGTAQHAVAYLAKADPLPALVLLDLKLPDMPGFELLRLLRRDEQLKAVPIIVLTGFENTGDIDRAYQLGANSYLTKPVSFADFQFTIAGLKRGGFQENDMMSDTPRHCW
jgi:two-component system, response regulator